MTIITLLLFILFFASFFIDEEYKTFTKILFFAFLISLIISITGYYMDSVEREKKRIKQQELVITKKREDQKQDSILIVLEAKIDNYLIKKDTFLARELINTFYHTSDSLSPYKSNSFFTGDKQLSYKEYWQQKRKEKLEKLEKMSSDSFLYKLIN